MSRQPLLLLDGAHNEAGALVLAAAVEEEFGEIEQWTLVLGQLRRTIRSTFLAALDLSDVVRVVACSSRSPRAIPAVEVAAPPSGGGWWPRSATAWPRRVGRALAGCSAEDGVLVTGSLHVVGEARAAVRRGIGLSPGWARCRSAGTVPGPMASDRTFVVCKPDAVERGLVGEIIARLERKGLTLVAAELRGSTCDRRAPLRGAQGQAVLRRARRLHRPAARPALVFEGPATPGRSSAR